MYRTAINRIRQSLWNVSVFGLAVVLGAGVCVLSLAQANAQNSLPTGAQGPISAALGKDNSDFWVYPNAKGFRGKNPRQVLMADFTRQGAEVRSEARGQNLHWSLEARGYGYGDALHPAKAVAPQAKANRVEYRREGMTEWYENGPLGLEQGFTLAHPSVKGNGRPLTVEIGLRGNMVAALETGSRGLELSSKDGKAAFRYTGLTAKDATGRELRSWLEVQGDRLLVRVEDGGARYPIVVDPWIQQAELTASDAAADDWFGYSVSVSGSTMVVGAPRHTLGSNQYQGAAYVFVESGGKWVQQAELTASNGNAQDFFGCSVAVNGSTVVVGATGHYISAINTQGAAYVFVESGGKWSQQAELEPSNGNGVGAFGYSVAVSGGTAVVGFVNQIVGSERFAGAAYVFAQSGETWSQQAELTASDGMNGDNFGASVAVDGSTVVVGASYHPLNPGAGPGAAYVFVQNGETWSQQAELTASDGAAGENFGGSVAVNGGTVVVGGNYQLNPAVGPGAAYLFAQKDGTWSQQAELMASDGVAGDFFGSSVAVSGGTAVVGSSHHTIGANFAQGAAYVFADSGGTWSQQAELTVPDGLWEDFMGNSVAVDGGKVVSAAYTHPYSTSTGPGPGAVYVFESASSQPVVALSPASLSFGNEVVNGTSAAHMVTLKNTGTGALTIGNIAASANFAISANTCGATLAAGKTCKVSVTFTPAKVGSLAGTLSFTDNASNSPQTATLSGTGITGTATVKLTPASAIYAAQEKGTTSKPKTFTLTNNQTVSLTNIAISTTGDFAVSAKTCGKSLAAKSKCTVSVTFTPKATGARAGTLRVSDSATNSPQTSTLKGTGK